MLHTGKEKERKLNSLFLLSSLVTLISLWSLSAFYYSLLLPGPLEVANRVLGILTTGDSYSHIITTLRRVLEGFIISLLLSLPLGLLTSRSKFSDIFIRPWLILGLTIPSLIWSLMGLLLFQISDLAAVFATAGVLIPILSQDFSQAAKNLDPHLSELASVFNIRPFARLRYIVLPQLLPAIFAVARYGLSLSWKVVIIAEVFGLSNGVGYQINYNYGLLRIDGVFAWTLVFAFIMFLIEYGLLYPLERYAFRWRHSIHNLP